MVRHASGSETCLEVPFWQVALFNLFHRNLLAFAFCPSFQVAFRRGDLSHIAFAHLFDCLFCPNAVYSILPLQGSPGAPDT